jgi:hypothetical protein
VLGRLYVIHVKGKSKYHHEGPIIRDLSAAYSMGEELVLHQPIASVAAAVVLEEVSHEVALGDRYPHSLLFEVAVTAAV